MAGDAAGIRGIGRRDPALAARLNGHRRGESDIEILPVTRALANHRRPGSHNPLMNRGLRATVCRRIAAKWGFCNWENLDEARKRAQPSKGQGGRVLSHATDSELRTAGGAVCRGV